MQFCFVTFRHSGINLVCFTISVPAVQTFFLASFWITSKLLYGVFSMSISQTVYGTTSHTISVTSWQTCSDLSLQFFTNSLSQTLTGFFSYLGGP